MLRSRVRRSFTVEVKSKSRQTLSWPDDPAPSPVNWAALDPAPETPSPFETSWSDEPATAASPVAAEKPRRILPSLIVAEPEAEVSEPVVEREARLPRVRRVKPAQPPSEVSGTDTARSEAAWSFADVCDAAPDVDVPAQALPANPVAASAPPPARRPSKAWAAEPALAPGQRWKRRLPRACR